jgi:hypothetical protein
MIPPVYGVFQESDRPERWVAEAIALEEGGVAYTVVFHGPQSETRAREYAEWKNRSAMSYLPAEKCTCESAGPNESRFATKR